MRDVLISVYLSHSTVQELVITTSHPRRLRSSKTSADEVKSPPCIPASEAPFDGESGRQIQKTPQTLDARKVKQVYRKYLRRCDRLPERPSEPPPVHRPGGTQGLSTHSASLRQSGTLNVKDPSISFIKDTVSHTVQTFLESGL